MNKERIRYILIILGVLDLVSFYRTYNTGMWILESWKHSHTLEILEFILILSFLFSGILLIIGKKISLVIYYFQFPFKLAFLFLTFGFVLRIVGLPIHSLAYKILLGFIIGLETVRLFFTIWIHRRYSG